MNFRDVDIYGGNWKVYDRTEHPKGSKLVLVVPDRMRNYPEDSVVKNDAKGMAPVTALFYVER